MGKVITTQITQEYCVPVSASIMFNEPVSSNGCLIYRQSAKVVYNILDPDRCFLRQIEESFVIQDSESPVSLSEIEAGFKGSWTDQLIQKSQQVVARETTDN